MSDPNDETRPREASPQSTPAGLLERAILALSSVCDGARTQDRSGFNKRDADFFASHVQTVKGGRPIPGPMRREAVNRLKKYQQQLFALGVNYNDVLLEEEQGGQSGAAGKSPAADPGLVNTLAEAITRQQFNYFAKDPGGKLYCFQGGAYRPGGEDLIRHLVKASLVHWKLAAKWRSHLADEVTEYIRVDAPFLWGKPPADYLNLTNGLLNLTTGQLFPHAPGFLSPIQLPIAYDPQATCPAIDRFIHRTFAREPFLRYAVAYRNGRISTYERKS